MADDEDGKSKADGGIRTADPLFTKERLKFDLKSTDLLSGTPPRNDVFRHKERL